MSIEDDDSRLGHDPLEWLQEDDSDEDVNATADTAKVAASEPESSTEPVLETPEQVAPAPEVDSSVANDDDAKQSSLKLDNHAATILLPERLTVHVVEPLHSEWKSLFYDVPQRLTINAQDTQDIDAAGMQLLYIMVQQLAFKGCEVEISHVHHNLQRNFNLAGLQDFFANYVTAA